MATLPAPSCTLWYPRGDPLTESRLKKPLALFGLKSRFTNHFSSKLLAVGLEGTGILLRQHSSASGAIA